MSDYEQSEIDCPKCGETLATRRCDECGGDGFIVDDEDECCVSCGTEHCDYCMSEGCHEWCRECGWDNIFKCFLSRKYEAEYLAKQQAKESDGIKVMFD